MTSADSRRDASDARSDASADASATRDGRSTRWDPHRRERRLRIITAAVDAVERYGPQASTAQIAERARVPRTHVYRHFAGKEALDLAVCAHVAREIGTSIRAGLRQGRTARELIAAAIDQHLGWIDAHPDLYRFLTQHAYAVRASEGGPAPADAKAAFAGELTALLESNMRVLGVDTAAAERVVVGVVGLVDATAAWWVDRRTPARPELTRELTEQVLLIIDRSARELGLALDPDAALPAPAPQD